LSKQDKGQETSLASEFFVVSQLYRLGYLPLVTLGHTKEIDIVIENPDTGKAVTVDVKGLRPESGNWPIKLKRVDALHFFIFVYFKDGFNAIEFAPKIFVVPSTKLGGLLKGASTSMPWVNPSDLSEYENKWEFLQEGLL
jgi:hypothetical protein